MQQTQKNYLAIAAIVLIAALSRILPHPMNFAPLGAMALFSSAYFGKNGLGLLITMVSWLLSDLILNNLVYSWSDGFVWFTDGAFYIYGSIVLIYVIGMLSLRKLNAGRVVLASLAASAVFFLLSNFGVWTLGLMYPMTAEGLLLCYTSALPFAWATVAGDLFYSGLLFIAFERVVRSRLKSASVTTTLLDDQVH